MNWGMAPKDSEEKPWGCPGRGNGAQSLEGGPAGGSCTCECGGKSTCRAPVGDGKLGRGKEGRGLAEDAAKMMQQWAHMSSWAGTHSLASQTPRLRQSSTLEPAQGARPRPNHSAALCVCTAGGSVQWLVVSREGRAIFNV